MSSDKTHTDTFVDNAIAFTDRHPDLNETQKAIGGTWYGILRALFECPNCPGMYRIPLDEHWADPGGRLYCRNCGETWTHI